MKEIRHLKTMKNKRNLNTKWLLLQNDQNADTTLLHSHDDVYSIKRRLSKYCHMGLKKQPNLGEESMVQPWCHYTYLWLTMVDNH